MQFGTVSAKNRQYNFRTIGGRDGLSANNVKSIVRDKQGFMWFGTKNGLNRYDGSRIKVYNCFDKELKIGNNNIGSLYVDEDSVLWIGTDRGIYRYYSETDQIKFVNLKPSKGSHPDNWVQRVTGDGKGNVWAVLPDDGIFRYYDGKVEMYSPTQPGDMKRIFPSDICVTSDGTVWVVTTGDGIMKFDHKADKFIHVNAHIATGTSESDSRSLCTITEGPSGNLLLATISGIIFEYSPTDNILRQVPFAHSGNIYLRYLQCFDDELWIGTQIGLYILNLQSGNFTELKENALNPFSIADDAIYTIYKDNEGGAWIGTMFGGVNYMPRTKFGFTVYGLHSGLSSRLVLGLAFDRKGNIWIGSETGGVNVLNPETGNIERSRSYNPAGNMVLSMTSVDGNIYAGFSRTGLYRCERDGMLAEQIFPNAAIDNPDVYSYIVDSRGDEWVGQGFALHRRKKGETKFTHISETSYDWIYNIFESSDGNVWFATMGNGIWKYNPNNGAFKSYIFDSHNPEKTGLRSNSINSIMEDSSGNLWFSTDRGGLSRYDKATDRFVTFGIREGLPDDVVYSVLEDNGRNLWFGTNHGLVRFTPSSGKIYVFDEGDGLPFSQFNYKSAIKTSDGRFYMGGINGLVSFNPDDFQETTDCIPIYFTGVNMMNREVGTTDRRSILQKNIVVSDRITLNYSQSTFTISVASPDFKHCGKLEFSYRLLPANREWTMISGHEISFTNLSPGEYSLEVKVDKGSGTNIKSLEIVILPPWWESVWAYMAYIVLLIMLVVVGVLLWLRRNKRQLLERERAFRDKKEKELYQSKVSFFTEIAHEIRTPLSLIDLPLEAIEEMGSDNPELMRYIKVSRQNTRRLLDLTGQLLDFQKIDSKRLTLKDENVNIGEFAQSIAERFEPSIELTGKRLIRNISVGELVVAVDREAITKIVSNLLNNARKYATQTITITVCRTTVDDREHYAVSVASDGRKIPAEERSRIFQAFYQSASAREEHNGVGIGLPLSYSLATLLGGSLVLENNADDLNIFTLTLPVTEPIVSESLATDEIQEYVVDKGSNQTKSRADIYSVLLVEDNESISSFIAEQLRDEFIVETAANGVEAMDCLHKNHYDIIVTDIMMPQMDGLELCAEVKNSMELSHTPLVFMTAKNDIDTKVKGLQLGGEAYVEKPFSMKYLKQLIKSLLDNRKRARESFQKNPFFTVSNMQMNKADEEFMEKVRRIIEENVSDEDFSVETMCDRLAMSRSSLLRKIKTLFNLAPAELIRVIKLKKAAELIQEGRYRISDVGFMVGIASPSYFSKIFARQFGMTPKEFEKQCRSKGVEQEE